jgi:hypothetical protein
MGSQAAKMAGDGLSVVEIAAWCGGLDAREVGRLAKLAAPWGAASQARVD